MTAATRPDIDSPHPLTADQIAQFRRDGYIKLKDVLSADVIARYGPVITAEVHRLNTMHLPIEQRDTYSKAFLQVMNIWTKNETVKEFCFGKKLTRLAAALLGVSGVRMYHDQALYKEPGGGITPWHADQYYWPLSNANTVTAWIPLQATPMELGPLAFAAGSHKFEAGRELGISDESVDATPTLVFCTATSDSQTPNTGPRITPPLMSSRRKAQPSGRRPPSLR